ncbi:MAG: thioredoxin-disulfide reductase [Planctomycetota bacterium]
MATEKVVIIGSGPAGLTACIYAARANLKPLCFEGYSAGGLIPGGQLMFTTEVENFPGFPKGVVGPQLMQSMRDQAEHFGTRFIRDDVTAVELGRRPFVVQGHDDTIEAHTVIIATGARANWLNLANEQRLAHSGGGVSACAVCDGALPQYRHHVLVVVGGGDSAVEEGSYLTKFAGKVYLVHRRDALRASKAMQDRFFRLVAEGKMEPIWNAVIVDVIGEQSIRAVRLRNVHTHEEWDFECRGLFLAIGHTPNTELFRGVLETDEKGYLKTRPGSTYTSIEGVFAAGDVADYVYRQAITAAGTGCMAALDAERWLAARSIE